MTTSSSSLKRYFSNPYEDFNGNNFTAIDREKWFQAVVDLAKHIRENEAKWKTSELDGGLYVGPAGIAYAFYNMVDRLPERFGREEKREFLLYARHLLSSQLDESSSGSGGGGRRRQQRRTDVENAFLVGNCGVHAVMAAVSAALGEQDVAGRHAEAVSRMARHFRQVGELYSFGSDELFVGRAGFLCAALWLNKEMDDDVVSASALKDVCDRMYADGAQNARRRREKNVKLMFSYHGTEYLGAGHGLSSILQLMMSVPGWFPDACGHDAGSDVKQCVEHYVDNFRNGRTFNYPPAADEALPHPHRQLVHWCHGAPGVVWMLARAFVVFKEQKFLRAALECGDCVWKYGLLRKGPGICHGVAGNGFVFLLLYRLTGGDKKHLYRALKFAEFMHTEQFRSEARTPDSPYSLYEGVAGTLCFLVALLTPETAAFPFFDSVFSTT